MKKLLAVVLAVAVVSTMGGVAFAADFDNYHPVGHGALNGPHYNLNIIGMTNTKNADSQMENSKGNVIFVRETGRTKILLYNSDEDPLCTKDFLVLDKDGTDGEASFCLPKPEITETATDLCPEPLVASEISYTVFARVLGTPGGEGFMTTCATDAGEVWCSSISLKLERPNGRSTFTDVSKYLLVLYVDLDGDGQPERYGLFAEELQDYFWRYDNDGNKLVQLRFYETPTCVPAAGKIPVIKKPVVESECVLGSMTGNLTLTGMGTANWTCLDGDTGAISAWDYNGPMEEITIDDVDVISPQQMVIYFTIDSDYVVPLEDDDIVLYFQNCEPGYEYWQSVYFEAVDCP